MAVVLARAWSELTVPVPSASDGTMLMLGAVQMLMKMTPKQRRRLGLRYITSNHQDLLYDRVWAAPSRLPNLLGDKLGNRNEAQEPSQYLEGVVP